MKIGRFDGGNGVERLSLVLPIDGKEQALDFEKATVAKSGIMPFRNTMSAFIEAGQAALDVSYETIAWAQRQGSLDWVTSIDSTPWMTPVEPRTFLCAGRNFGRHRDESLASRPNQVSGGIHFEFPTGFVQLPHTLVPHMAKVARPEDVKEFDYEIEVAAVIGKSIERVDGAQALDAVFGYTVFNDLSAREWQRKEMQNQMILIGKNFPGFGPIGPYILTADEVPNPSALSLSLKVNGEVRQEESCSDMIFDFPQLIAFWSRAGLQAGDMIASGTPGGVATHRKPDPFPFYLKPGDIVEASVSQIGILTTHII
jgi:2-keto-4-pentenoate hydratase/2-oxohepta-3-ene-1,7-dioic acid hydratase in catechol pathway